MRDSPHQTPATRIASDEQSLRSETTFHQMTGHGNDVVESRRELGGQPVVGRENRAPGDSGQVSQEQGIHARSRADVAASMKVQDRPGRTCSFVAMWGYVNVPAALWRAEPQPGHASNEFLLNGDTLERH